MFSLPSLKKYCMRAVSLHDEWNNKTLRTYASFSRNFSKIIHRIIAFYRSKKVSKRLYIEIHMIEKFVVNLIA